MLESPSSSGGSNSDLSSTANIATIKRYARPSQRNRSLGRRKSGGDRLDRSSIYVNEGEKNQVAASRSVPIVDHRDAGSSILVNENSHARLIYLHGCCGSEAFQLLNDRWAAAMNEYNNPSIDLAVLLTRLVLFVYFPERPVMYSGSSAWGAWGHFRLPHQLMSQSASVASSDSQMDFLSELKRAIRNANASSNT